jgi:hypothetical protein
LILGESGADVRSPEAPNIDLIFCIYGKPTVSELLIFIKIQAT